MPPHNAFPSSVQHSYYLSFTLPARSPTEGTYPSTSISIPIMCPHPPPSSARHAPAPCESVGKDSQRKPAQVQQNPTGPNIKSGRIARRCDLPTARPPKRRPTQIVPIAQPPAAESQRTLPTTTPRIIPGRADGGIGLQPTRKSRSYRDLDNGFCPRNCAHCGQSFIMGETPRFEEFCSGECLYSLQVSRWQMRAMAKRNDIRQQLTHQRR